MTPEQKWQFRQKQLEDGIKALDQEEANIVQLLSEEQRMNWEQALSNAKALRRHLQNDIIDHAKKKPKSAK